MNPSNPVKIIEINSCGGAKNTDLGVGLYEQTLTYFGIFRETLLLEIVYEDVLLRCPASADGLHGEGESGRGRRSTTHVTKLISPVKGGILIPFISLSWESDLRKI